MARERNDCPTCGFKLKGTRFTGYRCVRCHAHYSARFIAQSRRMHVKRLIDKHFGQATRPDLPATTVEKTDVYVEIDARLQRTLDRFARAAEESEEVQPMSAAEEPATLPEEPLVDRIDAQISEQVDARMGREAIKPRDEYIELKIPSLHGPLHAPSKAKALPAPPARKPKAAAAPHRTSKKTRVGSQAKPKPRKSRTKRRR